MKFFILVAMVLLGDVPRQPHVFLYTDLAECEAAREKIAKDVHDIAPQAEVFSECREVTRKDTKPQVDPKHRDPKSEKAT